MTATAHAVIGTVIAAKVANPALAIPLAFFSHFAADAFPHWDSATNIHKKGRSRVIVESFVDVTFGFILSYALVFFLFPQTNIVYAFVMIIASQGLDWLMAPYYFFDINIPPFTWAYTVQKVFDNVLNKPWGIISQIAAVGLIVILAKVF